MLKRKDVPKVHETDQALNVPKLLMKRAAEFPADVVIERQIDEQGEWFKVTSVEFLKEVTALAKGLIAMGLGRGETVAIKAHSSYEWS
ncbi:MAG: long-chain fatty acid--CoA ligase, partial [Bifidobacteriaceae bacterium]|nr:long-chain fatty acid--CoA ligase [Bifidobacteriaceae bacterium]